MDEQAVALARLSELLDAGRVPDSTVDFTDPEMTAAGALFARQRGMAQVESDSAGSIMCVLCDDEHPLLILDNEVDKCAGCGRRVQFRPQMAKLPGRRLCAMCVVAQIEGRSL